jgi:hypothetical protein
MQFSMETNDYEHDFLLIEISSKGLYQIQVYLCLHACYPMMQALLGFTCCIIRLYLACLIGSLH